MFFKDFQGDIHTTKKEIIHLNIKNVIKKIGKKKTIIKAPITLSDTSTMLRCQILTAKVTFPAGGCFANNANAWAVVLIYLWIHDFDTLRTVTHVSCLATNLCALQTISMDRQKWGAATRLERHVTRILVSTWLPKARIIKNNSNWPISVCILPPIPIEIMYSIKY